MPSNPLTAAQFAAYKRLFDPRSRFNNAVRAIRTAWGLDAGAQPGEGVQALPRTLVSWDFQLGGATGSTLSLPQDFGAGAYRNPVYHEYEGILAHAVECPFETQEQLEAQFSEDHVRAIDERCAEILTIFIQGLFPFTGTSAGDVLPEYDVLDIMPIDPDERPEEMREINIGRVRHRIRFAIRLSAFVSAAAAA